MTGQQENPIGNVIPQANPAPQVVGTADNTVTLRIPKPNTQVVVLGLVAAITLFQTFQLVQLGGNRAPATTKAAPAAVAPASTGGSQSGAVTGGSGADVPQSMVGGC